MNHFKVFYTNGQYYYTQANGTAAEFEAYLKQDGGRVTFEDSNGNETHLWIDRVEEIDTRHWYKLQGTYQREVTSLSQGARVEPFTQIIKAKDPRTAMDTNRQDLRDVGYDNILYTRVYVRIEEEERWSPIPMLEALGKE